MPVVDILDSNNHKYDDTISTLGATNTKEAIDILTAFYTGNNAIIGYQAGFNLTSGVDNVLLGYRAGYNLTTEDGQLHIANNPTESLIQGDFISKTVTINGTLITGGATSAVAISNGRSALAHNDSTVDEGFTILRFGHEFQVTEEFTEHNSSAGYVGQDLSVELQPMIIKVASDPAVAKHDAVTWGMELAVGYDSLTWNGVAIATQAYVDAVTTADIAEVTNLYYTEARVSANSTVSLNTADRHNHSNKTVLDNTTASFLTTDETKLDHISVSQAVDLDAMETKTNHITVSQAVDLDQIETDTGLNNTDRHNHANTTALDAVSGTNTGDQDLSNLNHTYLAQVQPVLEIGDVWIYGYPNPV